MVLISEEQTCKMTCRRGLTLLREGACRGFHLGLSCIRCGGRDGEAEPEVCIISHHLEPVSRPRKRERGFRAPLPPRSLRTARSSDREFQGMIKYGVPAIGKSCRPMHKGFSGSGGWNRRHAFLRIRSVFLVRRQTNIATTATNRPGCYMSISDQTVTRGLGWFVRFGTVRPRR